MAVLLQAVRLDTIPAKAQMQRYGEVLDNMGLRVAAPLLMAVCGRGSKTAAVEVVRDISRQRFDQARAREKPRSEQVMKVDAGLSIPALPTSPIFNSEIMPALIKEVISEAIQQEFLNITLLNTATPSQQDSHSDASLTQMLTKVLSDVQYLSGEMRWLKSTIDTERQLRRYLEKHGALSEPKAPAPADPDQVRRERIQNLSTSLSQDHYKSITGGGRPVSTFNEIADPDPLDL